MPSQSQSPTTRLPRAGPHAEHLEVVAARHDSPASRNRMTEPSHTIGPDIRRRQIGAEPGARGRDRDAVDVGAAARPARVEHGGGGGPDRRAPPVAVDLAATTPRPQDRGHGQQADDTGAAAARRRREDRADRLGPKLRVTTTASGGRGAASTPGDGAATGARPSRVRRPRGGWRRSTPRSGAVPRVAGHAASTAAASRGGTSGTSRSGRWAPLAAASRISWSVAPSWGSRPVSAT